MSKGLITIVKDSSLREDSKSFQFLNKILYEVVGIERNKVTICDLNPFLSLAKIKADVVIAIGEKVLNFLCDHKGILRYSGITIHTGPIPVVPIVSPLYVENNQNYLQKFAEDVQSAYYVSMGIAQKEIINQFKIVTDLEILKELIGYIKQTGYCSFDFETTELTDMGTFDPNFYCTTLALSFQQGSSFVIPLWHDESPFSDEELDEIFRLLDKDVFGNPQITKIGHYVKFDMHCAAWCGIRNFRGPFHCTMLLHQLINENVSHRLKDIVREYYPRFANYEKNLGIRDWAKIPLNKLIPYNALDADITMRLYWVFTDILMKENDHLYLMYRNLTASATKVLFNMEENGALIDKAFLIESIKKTDDFINEQETLLRNHYEVKKFEKFKTSINHKNRIDELQKKYDEGLKIVYKSKQANENQAKRNINYLKEIEDLKAGTVDIEHYQINFNSPAQLKELLFTSQGFGFAYPKKHYNFPENSTNADNLELIKDKTGFLEELKIYRQLMKISSTYLKGILNKLDKNHRIHTTFNQHIAKTGRLCIESNQLIQIPGGSKPIKDIQIGDLVYCYDIENKLKIRKVLNVWNKGLHPIVKIMWQSSGNKNNSTDYGYLLCTPNHFIKTFKGWVEAKDLKINDRLFHVARREHYENNSSRPRLYFSIGNMKKEQTVIKQELFNCFNTKIAIHHKDLDSSNNYPYNLELMSRNKHTGLHSRLLHVIGKLKWDHLKNYKPTYKYGKENSHYIYKTKYQLLKMLYAAGGRPTYVNMDFAVFKTKCILCDINISEVSKRFNQEGMYISRGLLKNSFEYNTHKKLKLGYYRAKELYNYYNMTNHKVVKVIPWGEAEVYDIEVEEFNNFIASEICVHNSSDKPNLQNIIARTKYKNVEESVTFVKKAFIVPEGYTMISADYSQIELRLIAYYANEDTMLKAYQNNQDLHEVTAANSHNYTLEKFKALDSKLYEQYRFEAKAENFGWIYGQSATGFQEYARNTYNLDISLRQAEKSRELFFKKYPKLLDYHKIYIGKAKKFGYVRTFFGRRIHLLDINSINKGVQGHAERNAINSPIQGTAGELTIFALNLLFLTLPEIVIIINEIHDNILFLIPDEIVDEAMILIRQVMEKPPLQEYFGKTIETVPLKIDFEISKKSWQDLKKIK